MKQEDNLTLWSRLLVREFSSKMESIPMHGHEGEQYYPENGICISDPVTCTDGGTYQAYLLEDMNATIHTLFVFKDKLGQVDNIWRCPVSDHVADRKNLGRMCSKKFWELLRERDAFTKSDQAGSSSQIDGGFRVEAGTSSCHGLYLAEVTTTLGDQIIMTALNAHELRRRAEILSEAADILDSMGYKT